MKLSTNFESIQSGLSMPDYATGDTLNTRLEESAEIEALNNGSQRSLFEDPENDLATLEWDAALAIQTMLRRSMRYEHGAHPWRESTNTGDCRSFALRFAEAAESSTGMDVLIVQAGVHVFNLVRSVDEVSVGIINSDEPLVSRRDVASAGLIGLLDLGRLPEVTDNNPLDVQLDTEKTNTEYWYHPEHDGVTSLYWLEAEKPAARIMTPSYALVAMRNYLDFDIALARGDIELVEVVIDAMNVASPIAEIRKHINMQVHDFDGLVKQWVMQGMDPLRVASVAKKYMGTMPDTPTAQDQFLGDWYRDIASGASRQGFPAADALLLVDESRRHYGRCIGVNPSNTVVKRKLELLEQLQLELQC